VDGTVFDDNYWQEAPTPYTMKKLIKGMREMLLQMTLCQEVTVWLHPDVGYGLKGSQDDIPPNALLQFDLFLIDIGQEVTTKCKKRKTLALGQSEKSEL